ncbi:MAG: hypothetical protein ACYSVY_07620, partial [Planctomycetota bacterium]
MAVSAPNNSLRKAFHEALNRHGYAFQHSAAKLARDLSERQRSPWSYYLSEFPVDARGPGTRIDFILRRGDVYLLAECKRANPALKNWCFARAGPVHYQRSKEYLFAEYAWHRLPGDLLSPGDFLSTGARLEPLRDAVCHIGLEVRSGEPGDRDGVGRGEIEGAITQILRGANGLVEHFCQNSARLSEGWKAVFIPVVFTTARL